MSLRRKSVSSSDVAKLAGVSRASVSRAFYPGTVLTEETRQKVIKAANKLGYRPNAIARSLILGQSSMVGIVIADLINPFYAEVLDRLCQNLQSRGFGALVLSADTTDGIDALIPKLLSYQVEGVIIAAATLTSQMAEQCVNAGRKVVLLNRYVDFADVSAVSGDNVAGGRLVAEHLAARGCVRPAFLGGLEDTSSSRDREKGFTEGLGAAGLRIAGRDHGNYRYVDAVAAARRLLSLEHRPDGIFCANDAMALAVMDVARGEFSLRIPQDLRVVGFDNTPPSRSTGYNLTSVDQDIALMTKIAVETLLASENDPLAAHGLRVLTPCRLERRQSS